MIVVFDGACNACNRFVRFLARHDRTKRFVFLTAQSERGTTILVANGQRPDDLSTMITTDRGETLFRSDAVLGAVAAMGGAWRFVWLFRIVPRWLRDATYTSFARRRYRWFGRAIDCNSCGTPKR